MVSSIAVACVNRLVPKRAKWGDYIESLLRPKVKVSEDDLDRLPFDQDRQRPKANRSTGRRGMWLIAFIGNELLTNL